MGPLRQKTVTVIADATSAINAAHQAIHQCGWSITSIDSSIIKASTGVSVWSWGETILIQVQVSGDSTYLNIQSKSGWALVDWGKNQENINKFLMNLSRLVRVG